MTHLLLRQPALSIAIGVSAFSSIGLIALFIFNDAIGMDFGVYWRAASETIATVYQPRDVLNFPYPPTMLVWISPLAYLPFWPAFIGWIAFSAWALATTCRKFLSTLGIGLVFISMPVVFCILNGQVTVALTALLLWACFTSNRRLAGIAFAVAASIKPQLVALAPLMLLLRRDWAALATASIASAAIAEISVLAYGFEAWKAWLASLDHFNAIVHKNGVLYVTVTPYATAQHWGMSGLPFLFAGVAAGALLVIACRDKPPLHQAAAIAAGSLLTSPYAIIHDLSAVVPFLAWSVFRGSIASAIAMGGTLNPLPLILTAASLVNAKLVPGEKSARACQQ